MSEFLYAVMDNTGALRAIVEMSIGDVTVFPVSLSFIDKQMYDALFEPPTLQERQAELEL